MLGGMGVPCLGSAGLNIAESGGCLEELPYRLQCLVLALFCPRILKAHGIEKLSLLD